MKKIRKELLLLVMCIFLINLVSANIYYNIELEYESEVVEIKKMDIEFSQYELGNYVSEDFEVYSAEIKNSEEVLEKTEFLIPNLEINESWDDAGNYISGEIVELDNVMFNIYIPFNENADSIVIYNENKEEITRKDISEYSKVGLSEGKREEMRLNPKVDDEDEKSDEIGDDESSDIEPESDIGWKIILWISIVIIFIIVFFWVKK